MLVCIVDFVYPPKKAQRQSFSESQEHLAEGVEDLATEEIEDDEEAVDNEGRNSDDDDEAEEEEEDDAEVEAEQKKQNNGDTANKNKSENKVEKTEATDKLAGGEASEITDKPNTEQVRKRKPRKAD